MGHGGSFLAIRQTRTNKLSTGHGALFLQLGKLEQTNFLWVIGSFLACKQMLVVNVNHESTCEERTAKRFGDEQGGSLSLSSAEKFVHK